MEKKFISYLRVSTSRQGASGLGESAQKEAITDFIKRYNGKVLDEFTEVESGKGDGSNRPQLLKALEACRRTGATLIIAKLDRLSRNVAFISSLMESGVDFTACDFPQANRLTIHVLAAVAEHEREMISNRTKEALRAAKSKGVKLGSPQNLTNEAAQKGRKLGVEIRKLKADRFALDMFPTIQDLMNQGLSLKKTAEELNRTGILTPSGQAGSWTHTTVKNVINRASRLAR